MQPTVFYLTDEQAEIVKPLLEAAEKDYDEKDQPGAVFFQIKRDYGAGPVLAEGAYLPEAKARPIKQIITGKP